MKRTTLALTVALAAFAGAPAFGPAKAASPERETIKVAFQHPIPNIPGKTLTGVVVTYPPGAKSPAHNHAKSAFITAYVLSGAIRSQVNGGETKVYHAGENWTEPPGAHHNVSENASATEPASLLAIFVADTSEKELTTFPKK
jgi:quercetin dioxygenase-like cupin family protein